MKKLNLGFTLIELMVVVSIIGILMAAGILAFSNAQQSARDAKRKADVQAIAKAEEQYFQSNGTYGSTANLATYFPSGAVPKDSAGTDYTLTRNGTNTQFCVCIDLDKLGSGNATGTGATGAGVCPYGSGATASFYCASQRQ